MRMPELTIESLKAKELNEYGYIATWNNEEKVFSNSKEAVKFAEEIVKTTEEVVSLWLEENGIRASQPYYINETNMVN